MPFCPECHQEQQEGTRCPMCRQFYQERRCPSCGAEVLPKEAFCGRCGEALRANLVSTVAARLEPASVMRRLPAGGLDLVVLLLSTEMLSALLPFPGTTAGQLLALLTTALAYFGLFQSGGRQTLGQHVLRLTVLRQDRRPLSLSLSLVRAFLAVAAWVSILVPLAILLDGHKQGLLDRRLGVRVFFTP